MATATPVRDDQGNRLGLITVVHLISGALCNEETFGRIVCYD
ncbi:MAG: hypothetical protein WCR27_08640 [Eubacteriales bacterium]